VEHVPDRVLFYRLVFVLDETWMEWVHLKESNRDKWTKDEETGKIQTEEPKDGPKGSLKDWVKLKLAEDPRKGTNGNRGNPTD